MLHPDITRGTKGCKYYKRLDDRNMSVMKYITTVGKLMQSLELKNFPQPSH